MRITADSIYNLRFPELRTKSFHARAGCLQDWKYHNWTGSKVNTLPVFSGKIAISPAIIQSKLEPQYQQQLNELKTNGIVVTSQTPFNTSGYIDGIIECLCTMCLMLLLLLCLSA
jgi:hypothetical protein